MTKQVTKVVVYFDDGTYVETGPTPRVEDFFPQERKWKDVTPAYPFPQPWPNTNPQTPFINKEYILD